MGGAPSGGGNYGTRRLLLFEDFDQPAVPRLLPVHNGHCGASHCHSSCCLRWPKEALCALRLSSAFFSEISKVVLMSVLLEVWGFYLAAVSPVCLFVHHPSRSRHAPADAALPSSSFLGLRRGVQLPWTAL